MTNNVIIFTLAFLLLLVIALLPRDGQWRLRREARRAVADLTAMRECQRIRRVALDGTEAGRRAAWLYAKADYALTRAEKELANTDPEAFRAAAGRVDADCARLLMAVHQAEQGVLEIVEEPGARLRAYRSEIDGTFQT